MYRRQTRVTLSSSSAASTGYKRQGTETCDVESQVPYCLAADPYYSLERGFASNQVSARGVLVPKSIMDSQLVELYLGDGADVDYAEKVEEASNGYVKMWKVEE